jgi:hypothetical protein
MNRENITLKERLSLYDVIYRKGPEQANPYRQKAG